MVGSGDEGFRGVVTMFWNDAMEGSTSKTEPTEMTEVGCT